MQRIPASQTDFNVLLSPRIIHIEDIPFLSTAQHKRLLSDLDLRSEMEQKEQQIRFWG